MTIDDVKDNSIGIQVKHNDHVFKPFKRLHRRDEYGGGLTIVKRLVERHRGRVGLDSCPVEGTTFYFTLCGDEETSHVQVLLDVFTSWLTRVVLLQRRRLVS
jgi:light-regulated signal transduction histidine kinase (bacteriophytochrome)